MIIAPNPWKLRKAVRIVNQVLDRLKVEKHPDKTFIGRTEKGFDFLGYHLKPESLAPTCQTVKKHAECICRLYEQGASYSRIRQYVWRWMIWLKAGLTLVLMWMSVVQIFRRVRLWISPAQIDYH